jgi:enamine deaminase RidA (YjgF/YER057c/UK114 family)
MPVEHVNPDTLVKNPAFSQVVTVTGGHKTIYIGGQDAVDGATRAIIGKADIRAQTQQVLKNLRAALAAVGAGLEHIVKWNIYIVQGHDPRPAFEVFMREWGGRSGPPAISMLVVAGLANPDFLIEIDAVAALPDAS